MGQTVSTSFICISLMDPFFFVIRKWLCQPLGLLYIWILMNMVEMLSKSTDSLCTLSLPSVRIGSPSNIAPHCQGKTCSIKVEPPITESHYCFMDMLNLLKHNRKKCILIVNSYTILLVNLLMLHSFEIEVLLILWQLVRHWLSSKKSSILFHLRWVSL